jgi:biopolymer transport protein ExbB/TolQ
MSIRMNCPNCQGVIEAKEELIGAEALCPYCRKTVTVQKAPPRMEKIVLTPPDQEGARGNGEPKKPKAPKVVLPEAASDAGAKPVDGQTGFHVTTAAAAPVAAPVPLAVRVGKGGLVISKSGQHRDKRNRLAIMVKSLFRPGNPTDPGVVLTGLGAAALTYLLYKAIIFRLDEGNTLVRLLAGPSWVYYATVFFTMWAAVVLIVKYWKIATQQESLSYDLLPADRSAKITPSNVELIESHLKKLPLHPRKSFLIRRLLLALDNFKARKSVPEVGALLSAQAETDGAVVDSSYAMLKVLIWCIPILGFIGTVVGISQAVREFDQGIQAADADIRVIKSALGSVTNGLAVAFDTTYLGLILSMVIMFPTNSVQKAEEDLLSEMEEYCNENLLPRLATDEEPRGEDSLQFQETQRMLTSHQAALLEWQKRLENLETALLEKVVDTLQEVRKEMAAKDHVAKN